MKLSFTTHKKQTIAKEKRFNPHHFWMWYVGAFTIVLIVELGLSSWYFLAMTKRLDASAIPTLETNAAKIKSMQRKVDAVDAALKLRAGEASDTL